MGGVDWGCATYTPHTTTLLQNWLSSQRLPPQKLSLQPLSSGGRGLVAKTNIRQGEKLLYVPSSLIITTDSEWSNPHSGGLLLAEDVPDWPFLATFLISEASKGKDSPWHSYISALPQEPGSILLWSETEVRLESLNQQIALVPWADMLNHSSQVKACLDFEATSKAVILTTDRPYRPSEEVFVSYGDKSKGEILLSYGFVSSDNNAMDSVDLSFALRFDDESFAAKQAALKEHGLSLPCSYPLTITGLPSQLFAFAYLAASPPSMASYFSQMAAAAVSKETGKLDIFPPFMFDIPLEIDIQAHEIILKTVEASLTKISRFLEDNQASNSNGMANKKEGKPSKLKQPAKLMMACTLYTSDQRILHRAQYVLRSKLRELRTKKISTGKSPLAGSGLLYGLGKLFK